MKTEKISIIMPAYNAEKYLMEAVQSVRAQTWEDWELLIIDDGSTDSTARIAAKCQREDARIRYIRNSSNLGAAGSRNAGIRQASGEWLAFLDSDDRWEAEKLEKQMKTAKEKNAAFLYTGSGFMDENGGKKQWVLDVPETVGFRGLLKQNVISCSSVLIRKDWMRAFPEKQVPIHEDFAVWLEILKEEGKKAYGVNEPLLIYRIRSGSKSGNKRKAAAMTFRVYRLLGLPLWKCVFCFVCYTWNGLRKYSRLR